MARRPPPRHVRIFLASPGDVIQERQEIRKVLERLERSPSIRWKFTIEAVSWDDPDAPVPMLATLTPQQAVNLSLPMPSECDFTIVILASRMGTPLEERKPDGSAYLSGTEWEFEDARRAGRPILLYRRAAPSAGVEGDAEAALQLRHVEQFLAQFRGPGGTLRGGITTYSGVDELAARVRTDIESLLQTLRPAGEELPAGGSSIMRAREFVRSWPVGRWLMFMSLGGLVTVAAWIAVTTFPDVVRQYDPPPSAYVVLYVFVTLGVAVPVAMAVVTWWWLGQRRARVPSA